MADKTYREGLIALPRWAKRGLLIGNDFLLLSIALWAAYSLRLGVLYVPPDQVALALFALLLGGREVHNTILQLPVTLWGNGKKECTWITIRSRYSGQAMHGEHKELFERRKVHSRIRLRMLR